MFQTNSPDASTLVMLSFRPEDEKAIIGGASHIALKKLYGARLGIPFAPSVEIHPIGRGATIALNGSCRNP